jgi:oligopeptide transport system ATP-binding protein
MTTIKKEPLIELRDIKISFGSGRKKVEAVKDVSFDIYKGETFGLVGESGSGKTTIGRAIVGIQHLSSGRIYFKEKLIRGKIPSLRRFAKSINLKLNNLSEEVHVSSNALETYVNTYKITYYKYLFNQVYDPKTKLLKPMAKVDITHSTTQDEFKTESLTKAPIQYDMIIARTVNDIKVLNRIIDTIEKTLRLIDNLEDYTDYSKKDLVKVTTDYQNLLEKCHKMKDLFSDSYLAFKQIAENRVKARNGQYKDVKDFIVDIGKLITTATKNHNLVVKEIEELLKFDFDFKNLMEIDQKIKLSSYFKKPSSKEKYELKRKIQMIFQDPASSLNDRMSVEQIISEGLHNFESTY